MKELGVNAILAGSILREQIGGKYEKCFQETKVCGIPIDQSTKQGGRESPSLLDMVLKSVFMPLQESGGGEVERELR